MNSKGLGGSAGSVEVITEIVDISRSQGNAKQLWPSIRADGHGDRMLAGHAPEQNMWNMTPDAECLLSDAQASCFPGTSAREDFDVGTSNSCLSQVTDGKTLHRRSGKAVRSNSSSYKRPRIVQIEVSMNETGVEDVNEKPQIKRQKSNANGKQRDKRNGKLLKSRSDSFSLKNGLVSFNSVAGGGSLLAYGCKSDKFDATSHVNELPLDKLLDGSYTCQSLVKDKGKTVQNMDDNLLNSVRKAFSVLQLQNPIPSELEHDNYDHKEESTCSPESRTNGGAETLCGAANQSSIDKDCISISRTKVLSALDDSQLYEPKDVLNLIMLPPPKELETLLIDAVKPISSSKNSNDNLRLMKTITNRTGLPPFPWSLNLSGHSKSGPDSFKLAANRPSCQGRWLKVENSITSPKVYDDDNTGFLVNFETLSFDQKLVPIIVNQQFQPIENKNGLIFNEQGVSSSSAHCPPPKVPLGEHSSGFLAAVETLYEISSRSSSKEGPDDTITEAKKSQKPIKTSKLNPNNVNSPSKKVKLLTNGHTTNNWSAAPKSIRSSSSSSGSKLLRESVSKLKMKKSYMMMPPPSNRIIDKGSGNNQLKLKDKIGEGHKLKS